MCGIFALITKYPQLFRKLSYDSIIKGKHRGPEHFNIIEYTSFNNTDTIIFGFNRLAINGLTDNGMQPFIRYYPNDPNKHFVSLICNGEIYNHKLLEKYYNLPCESGSDCEVICHLFMKFGINYTLSLLHGVFAFVIYDSKTDHIFVARDRFGIRPVFTAKIHNSNNLQSNKHTLVIASEMKQIFTFKNDEFNNIYNIELMKPGTFLDITIDNDNNDNNDNLSYNIQNISYWSLYSCFSHNFSLYNKYNTSNILKSLINSVRMRVSNCERQICCLLSGGLDSSIIAALVSNELSLMNKNYELETYSIGIKGSHDLHCAKIVANHIKSNHTEIHVTEDEMFDAIPNVIDAIESYDVTSVRASVGNWLVCKYIKEHSDAKIVFNGDGADELMGGYQYFNVIKDDELFLSECLRLLDNIHYYDVLRSDRSISNHGLEARTPFLDQTFVSTYLTEYKYRINYVREKGYKMEKSIIRDIIQDSWTTLLPNEILWRRKEAFSDGVSGETRSWSDAIKSILIQRETHKIPEIINIMDKYNYTLERAYYCMLFMKQFNLKDIPTKENYFHHNYATQLETMWMPKFVNATDPSARTLENYNK